MCYQKTFFFAGEVVSLLAFCRMVGGKDGRITVLADIANDLAKLKSAPAPERAESGALKLVSFARINYHMIGFQKVAAKQI